MHNATLAESRAFHSHKDIDLNAFSSLCAQKADKQEYLHASGINKNIIIYQGPGLVEAGESEQDRRKIKEELHRCLKEGPGVFVIKDFYNDGSLVDQSTDLFAKIIKEEKENTTTAGDHFAKAGENDRIWNSFQKVCEQRPSAFIDYYRNPLYALVSEAWLGPGYQITAQVNVVRPGGQAQSAHRDFHLGFQSEEVVAQFPLALQVASQYLTLQGAIAHTDMPIESGPTLLLPFSQKYDLGYLAWRDEGFKQYFNEHAVQLPLNKGDAIFFSPALFHAAGSNTTDKDRVANLIQISSAFSKPMETLNRDKMMKMVYPELLQKNQSLLRNEIEAVVAVVADGYSFPTNLDVVTPVGGVAPETGQQLMIKALEEKWPVERFDQAVDQYARNRSA